ncbi:hypothetical protein [Leptolyngbya phage Lbo-JY46]
MKDEYIIINKTAIHKRIEELKVIERNESMNGSLLVREEIETLERVISQSTPLIPEIVKAINASNKYPWSSNVEKDYISNLKLDINKG